MPNLNVPGLSGWLAAEDESRQNQASQLQQMSALQTLAGNSEKQRRDLAYRAELQALGPNPTQEALLGVATKYGGPDVLVKTLETAQTARERVAAQKELATARLEQNAKYNEMMHEWRMSQAKTAEERAAESARHNGVMEGIQGELARIRGDQLKQQGDAKEDANIEKAIAKTQTALKDVQPVMVAGRQLNKLLSQYTPDTVPGVGYLKNTDTGKAFLSQEGKDVSSSIKLVGNAILKAMSGTAVTAPEEVRQMAAQMADGRYGAKDFYIAWPKISEWLNSQAAVATSTLPPAARERFIERTGLDLSPITPRFAVEYNNGQMNLRDTRAQQPASAPRITSDADYNALPAGSSYIAPDGSLRKKK